LVLERRTADKKVAGNGTLAARPSGTCCRLQMALPLEGHALQSLA
jgi:hypothetical protein